MSTWHQDQAVKRALRGKQKITPLYHETKWTVVIDPPKRMRCTALFGTVEEADEYISNLKKHGNGDHAYTLPPGGV